MCRCEMRKVEDASMVRSRAATQRVTSTRSGRRKVSYINLEQTNKLTAGWAPSEFKSSRNNRAQKVQKAEDFMDEEDLQQMNEDRQLENTETFKNDAFAGERETGAR